MFMSCRFPLQPRHVDGVLYVDFYGISTVNTTAPSQSEEYQRILSYSVFSCSHYWGKPSSGSTPTKTNIIHGTFARLLSWQNFFLQPRLMLCVGRFQVSNNNMMNHSLKHGKDSRIILNIVLIIE